METNTDEELFFRIALTQTGWIGDKMARNLLNRFHTASGIFKAPVKRLASIGGLGERKTESLKSTIDSRLVEKEMRFIKQHRIIPLFYSDSNYPQRLKDCADAPLMLYYKGNYNLNDRKIVAVVGTRKNTDYGAKITEDLIEKLQQLNVAVVSGMAFGIDIIAHRKAVQYGIPTIGVMAHGLDMVYPEQHRHIARDVVGNGGLLTEYPSGTMPDRFNFPMRNRIVAGMADATIVVETETKGGAMITAKLAASYNGKCSPSPEEA